MRTAILAMLLAAGCAESVTIPEDDASVAPDADVIVAPDANCACSEGPCCDGACGFLGPDTMCIDDGAIGPATCETERRIASAIGNRYCSGVDAECNGRREPKGSAAFVSDCGNGFYGLPNRPNTWCIEDGSALGASCVSTP